MNKKSENNENPKKLWQWEEPRDEGKILSVTYAKLSNEAQISLPQEVIEHYFLNQAKFLKFIITDEKVLIEPVREPKQKMREEVHKTLVKKDGTFNISEEELKERAWNSILNPQKRENTNNAPLTKEDEDFIMQAIKEHRIVMGKIGEASERIFTIIKEVYEENKDIIDSSQTSFENQVFDYLQKRSSY